MSRRIAGLPPSYLIILAGWWMGLNMLVIPACTAQNPLTIERPNARTQIEEQAFNTLLVSERIITTAEASNAAGTLPDFMKPLINGLIDAHNLGKRAADGYVAVIGSETEGEKALELLDLMGDLDDAISKMFQRGTP